MVKSSNPWLRGLLRAGKKQQRSNARALKILLTQPKPPKASKPVKAVKAVKTATARTVAPRKKPAPVSASSPSPLVKPLSLVRPSTPASVPRAPLAAPGAATGKWLTSHCAAPAEPGALTLKRMSYWLYLPERAPAPAGWPLVVMLHGCEQSATLFAQGTRMNRHAEKAGYAVLYPQQSMSRHPQRCWKWYGRATQQGGGDVPTLVALVQKVLLNYPIDPSRVYICGMSAGAAMAHIVALNHPRLFAALGMHSGPLFGAGHSALGALAVMQHGAAGQADSAIAGVLARQPGFPPLPTVLIQGEDDPVVRPVNQALLERQSMLVNRLGPDSRTEVLHKPGNRRSHPYWLRDVYRGRALMLRVARIAELKHAWSGGDQELSFNSGAGPDASKLLLDFFRRHRRAP